MNRARIYRAGVVAAAAMAGAALGTNPALADPFAFLRPPAPLALAYAPESSLPPPEDQGPALDAITETPEHLRRQIVSYGTAEAPGTIVIDTRNTYLYYVLGGGTAIRYGIGVGREGFTWSGVESISAKAEWPDWIPPAQMLQRQPYLPRWVAGGPGNPLGARAMYLGNTAYRIHGTNDPSSIGKRVSSGCIRMLNEDVVDLFSRASVGTKVVVLPAGLSPPVGATGRDPAQSTQETAASVRVNASGLY
jgi:lipoprotein-anchoring transpeptidase ErfK/SrfK